MRSPGLHREGDAGAAGPGQPQSPPISSPQPHNKPRRKIQQLQDSCCPQVI